jgi:hypothetical protein
VLHLHQVAQRTFTSKLLNMPGTQRNRSRGSLRQRSAAHGKFIELTEREVPWPEDLAATKPLTSGPGALR